MPSESGDEARVKVYDKVSGNVLMLKPLAATGALKNKNRFVKAKPAGWGKPPDDAVPEEGDDK